MPKIKRRAHMKRKRKEESPQGILANRSQDK